jgi:hypothetical protein
MLRDRNFLLRTWTWDRYSLLRTYRLRLYTHPSTPIC